MKSIKIVSLFLISLLFTSVSFCFYPLEDERFDVEDRIIKQDPITVTMVVNDTAKLPNLEKLIRVSISDWFDNVLKRKDKYPNFDIIFKDILPYLNPDNIKLHFIESKNYYTQTEGFPFIETCLPEDNTKQCKDKIKWKFQGNTPFTPKTVCYDALFYENADLVVIDLEIPVPINKNSFAEGYSDSA